MYPPPRRTLAFIASSAVAHGFACRAAGLVAVVAPVACRNSAAATRVAQQGSSHDRRAEGSLETAAPLVNRISGSNRGVVGACRVCGQSNADDMSFCVGHEVQVQNHWLKDKVRHCSPGSGDIPHAKCLIDLLARSEGLKRGRLPALYCQPLPVSCQRGPCLILESLQRTSSSSTSLM